MKKFFVKECKCWIEVGDGEQVVSSYRCDVHQTGYQSVLSFKGGGTMLHLSNEYPYPLMSIERDNTHKGRYWKSAMKKAMEN